MITQKRTVAVFMGLGALAACNEPEPLPPPPPPPAAVAVAPVYVPRAPLPPLGRERDYGYTRCARRWPASDRE